MWIVYMTAYILVGALCATWRDPLVFGPTWEDWWPDLPDPLLAALWPAALPAWLAARGLRWAGSRPYRLRTRLAYRLGLRPGRSTWQELDGMRRLGPVCATCERFGRACGAFCHRCGDRLVGLGVPEGGPRPPAMISGFIPGGRGRPELPAMKVEPRVEDCASPMFRELQQQREAQQRAAMLGMHGLEWTDQPLTTMGGGP